MKARTITASLILIFFVSCKTNNTIVGKYRSNFASHGFFITEIELKPDTSFIHIFSGDMQYNELKGKYKIKKNKLYLRFERLKNDTLGPRVKDTLLVMDMVKDSTYNIIEERAAYSHDYELKKEYQIEHHLKYKISKNKLQSYNVQTDRLVKRANKYSKRKKYIFFGSHYYKKKCYLKKVENKDKLKK